jgi:hypothetical protein
MRTALEIGLAGALIAVSAGVPWALQHRAQVALGARQRTLEQQASRLSSLAAENGRLSNLVAQATASRALSTEQLHELLRLRNERRSLAEQTNLLARLAAGTSDQERLSRDELEPALASEMVAAMKRILPGLPSALQNYARDHSNQVPDSFSELQDYFPLVAGRKMPGLQAFEFVRDGGPKLGDALVLRGNAGLRPADKKYVHVYGFSDGRVVEVAAEDGHVCFDDWEAQHLTSALAGTEDKVNLEAEETTRERAHLVEVGASVGISAEDATRFFDRLKQEEKTLGPRMEELRKSLTGSPEEQQQQMRAAVQAELNKLAIETLGDKGPALVQKMTQGE